ncbi:GIY-YIG nuclease family protein [Bacillus cereus]|nr:GIY-YIG nuclease family protein [Bacillus cereus]
MKKWYNDHINWRYIYALFDSIDGSNVYIGQSINVEQRYATHDNPWVNEQFANGHPPTLITLEKARLSQYEAYQLEMVWLRVALRQGFMIHNSKADVRNAWRIWEQLKPLTEVRKLPKLYEQDSFKTIEDESILEHLHHSWIRLIGEH